MGSQLQNKLLHYEVQPPEGVWDKVTASLDENISLTLSEKLYNYEEDPSPKIWQILNARLDNLISTKARIVPFYIKYRRPLKYSGAVAIFIFLAVISSLLISKKTESEVTTQTIANTSKEKKDTADFPANSKEENTSTQQQEGDKPNRLIAKSKISRVRTESPQNSFSITEDLLPQQAYRNEVVTSSIPSDKYMIYSDGDGNAIRLPKKIFSAFACPTEDIICKQKLQQLKEKFAASAMTADFTGLIQILKSLQENQ